MPSPALVNAAYNAEPADSTISGMSNQIYPAVLPPQPVQPPQLIGMSINDHTVAKSSPKSVHPPALPSAAYSSPLLTGSMTITPPYSATPVLNHIKPKGHNVSPMNSQVNLKFY